MKVAKIWKDFFLASRLGVCLAVVVTAGCPACGYRLAPTPESRSLPFRTVSVPLFRNDTQEPRIENELTAAFRSRLLEVPAVRLARAEEADAVLRGRISAVQVTPVAVSEQFFAMEYRIEVTLSLLLEQREGGKILARLDSLREEARFYASSDALLAQDNRSEAILRLSRSLAARAWDAILLGF